jgi:hypothetical protein
MESRSPQGTPPPHSAEKLAQGIKKYYLEIFNFHTLTSPIRQMKETSCSSTHVRLKKKKVLQRKHNIYLC